MLDNTLSKVVYVADGIQKQWDIPFEFYKIEDVHIYTTSDGEHIEEIDQNYYYDEEGKFFVYPTEESKLDPIPAGTQVLILRETENTQLEDSSEIYFKSKDIERGLDNLTMQVQDLKRDSLRAVKLSHFATQTPEDFTKGIFEAEKRATEAAAKASLSEQNAASSETSAVQASASATASAELAQNASDTSLQYAERAENAAADASISATQASESANMASDLLQEVSHSIYNKAQVDAKISDLQAEIDTVESNIDNKQDKLIAGSNITIDGNVISATGGGGGGGNAGSADIAKAIENQNKATDTVDPIYNWLGTKQEYEEQNIAIEHPDWVCFITDDMGEQGGGGGGSSEAVWGNIAGDINAQTDLTNLLSNTENKIRADVNTVDSELQAQITAQATAIDGKQDKLTAGEGVTIEGNVISATGGGGSAELPDNVYTQENLLGGKNVEIVPEPVEGGIDEHTLAYWPFDGSEYDEVSGARAYDVSFYNTNPVPAVGTNYVASLSGCSVALSDLTSDWTIEGYLYGGGPSINFAWTLGKGTHSSNTTYITGPSLRINSNGVYLRNTYPSDPIEYPDTTLINSGWVHLALQRKKDLLQAFVNGKKILETNVASDKISGDLMFRPMSSATGHYIDNVRFSNVARYDGDFTPPTQPYTKAEPTGNKVINFTGVIPSKTSELENNSGFLTPSNLLGGKDIEIIPEPVEGGIDEYTLSCFHLDGTAVDEVTKYTLSPTMDNSVHKFGTGSSMWTNSTSFPWSLNSYESFSFDYWYYHKTSRSSYLGLRKINFAIYLLGLYFQSGATKPGFYIFSNKHSIDVDFEQNKWTHVYVYYNAEDRSFHLFVNGKEVFSTIDSTDFSGVKDFSNDGYTESRFDEIRISKCIRWTEDFEPPTQPYRKAEPTGNYVVNFTGKESSSGGASKNIGEVYYSQSSLATDNAGALPLFTGETITSANTIYPDFYAWVEKHPELATNPTEYQNLLDKYGECPLYCLEQVASEESRIVYTYNFTDLKQNCLDTLDYVYGYFDGNSFVKIDKDSEYSLFYTAEQMSDTGTINQYPVYLDSGLTKRLYGYAKTDLDDDYKYRPLFLSLNIEYSYIRFSIFVGEEQNERSFGSGWSVAPSTITSTQGSEIAKFYSYTKDGSLRLPKLTNYVKMANTAEGITQSEAGLPNITGSTSYNNGSTGMWLANNTNIYQGAFVKQGTCSGYLTGGSGTGEILGFDASVSSEVYGKSDTVTPAHTTLYPWVYAFSAAIPVSTAQAAEFQQGLSGKADTNLGNIPTNYDYVVERYDDEQGNWYEVWKSGKLRQGGFLSVATISQANHVITFLKPFADTFYSFVNVPVYDGQMDTRYFTEKSNARTTTSVTVVMTITRSWQAEGKGA